ncbi:conserved protein of unknown function [Acidithiobacillus ferrivorans]|uniref:Uncharacterized protein n=1 Tax=Acidithiobacillus ferrivorans TaxID=160808 RepID=A0A060UQ41_9PROT|nr:conserved hypothetical protein [Acidithiobacillus ferrivorans]SMH64419.1 conserved protein of unknown function [Acidithiobacillus ferrivorans]
MVALASGAADSIGIVALPLSVVVVAGAADSVVVVALLSEAAVVSSFLAHAEASAMALATRMIRATGLILAISNMF